MLNENIVKGKWLEIRGDLQKTWGKLTNDALDKTMGDMKSIGGLVQQMYGKTQAEYDKKIADIFQRYETKKDDSIAAIKTNLKN